MTQEEKKSESPAEQPTSGLEWAVAALGALLVLAALAVLVRGALGGAQAPPDIAVRVERVTPVRAGFLVRFVAENAGDETAATVQVRGEAAGETASAELDYLPGHSEREGGLFFRRDPRGGPIALRVEGFEDP